MTEPQPPAGGFAMPALASAAADGEGLPESPGLAAEANLRLRIGAEVVDFGALQVVTRPEAPRLTSKAAAVLLELARHAGDTLTRNELLDRVWAGRCPTPDVLTQAIKELRRAFADDGKAAQYIQTIPKVGYRLVAPVSALAQEAGGERAEPDDAATAAALFTAAAADNAERRVSSSTRRLSWLVAAASVVFLVAGVLALAFGGGGRAAAPPDSQPDWQVSDARMLTSDPGPERRPHVSAGGTRVAFTVVDPHSGMERVVVQSVEPSSQRIPLTADAGAPREALPVWSPDASRIAFERKDDTGCSLFVVPSLGGDEREVGQCGDYRVNYFDWTPDGRALLTATAAEGRGLALARLDLDSGQMRPLDYERAAGGQDLEPRHSPDGRWIAFRRGLWPYSDLYVMPAAGGRARQVTRIASLIRGYTWLRDSQTLVFASNHEGSFALYAVDVASTRVQALGVSPAQYPDAARADDTVVYELPRLRQQLARIMLGDGGAADAPQLLAPSTGSDQAPQISPDGQRLAFISDRSGQAQLWLHELAGGATTQLTTAPETTMSAPQWSPDGTRLVAVRADGEARELVEIDLASRRLRPVSAPGEQVLLGAYDAAPDSYLLLTGQAGARNQLVRVQHPGEPGETRRVLVADIAHFQLDAPGRALYYTPLDGTGLFRSDLDGGHPRLVTRSVSATTMNGWNLVGGRIWYLSHIDRTPVALSEVDPANGAERIVAQLGVALRSIAFTARPDGKGLILTVLDGDDTDIGAFRLIRRVR
jgi:Tol biopolymer transport system component/DNA-binding winged helix-turn-helix (wHTH) protein